MGLVSKPGERERGKWGVESGKWEVGNGKWGVGSGKWEWRVVIDRCHPERAEG